MHPAAASLAWLGLMYAWGSVIEWATHKWTMHGLGWVGALVDSAGMTLRGHMEHHSETALNQDIPPDFRPEGIVFDSKEMWIMGGLFSVGAIVNWKLLGLDTLLTPRAPWLGATAMLGATVLFSLSYFWIWNSFHSAYHRKYIHTNRPIPNPKSGTQLTLWSPLPYFSPDTASPLYRSLFKYHTLHHLNKGDGKGNFNIMMPLADLLLGSYTRRVDNTRHFATHPPRTAQESWLASRPVFDIAVQPGNRILYREPGGKTWEPLPEGF